MLTNEMIKTEIRKVNKKIKIEEFNRWDNPDEAIRRCITYAAMYINGKPILPMAHRKFLQTLKTTASELDATA
jgi:hypothetical protein